MQSLETALQPWRGRFGHFHLAGADVITRDLDTGSKDSLASLAPLVIAAMCLVLYLATREWRAVAAAALVIVIASLWSIGLVAHFARPMNLMLATVPAILAVVTITQANHILSRFHALPSSNPANPAAWWSAATSATFRPNLLCALTTAAGFASLGLSRMPPVRDLGLFTAAGVLLSFALCFTLFPALLATSPSVRPRGSQSRSWWNESRAKAYTAWLGRRGSWILAGSAVVAIIAAAGVLRLRTESHILEFFPNAHPVPTGYRAVERHLIGMTPLEFVVDGPASALLADSTMQAYRKLLEDTLREEPLSRQVISILLEPSRSGKLEFVVPPEELREALASEGIPQGLEAFLRHEDGRYFLRTTLLASTESSNACHALVERFRSRVEAALPPGVNARVTGASTLLIEGQVLLLETQIRSFGTALAIIGVLILAAFRSFSAALLALPPNLLPIGCTLGLMGWTGIPLNTATVTVAGIALGLVVDDTVHFIHEWVHQRARLGPDDALANVLHTLARPVATTSVAVAVGFGVFAFAPFRPTAYFGLLISVTAAAALVCDLVFFPVLLRRSEPKAPGASPAGHASTRENCST